MGDIKKNKTALRQENSHFREIFENNFSELCYFSNSFVYDWDLCEDIVQNAFIKLWDIVERFPEEKAIRAWLFKVVRNECLDHLKSNEHKNKFRIQALEELTKEAPPDINDLEVQDIKARIDAVLASMPETTQKIFRMSRQEGMAYSKIAEDVGLTEKSVEYHVSKALSILKEQMKDCMHLLVFLM
ncbi:MAG: RNA polymerase sigma-70 factor [Marinilabilia sp.]